MGPSNVIDYEAMDGGRGPDPRMGSVGTVDGRRVVNLVLSATPA